MIFDDEQFGRQLLAWYAQNRRDLPWRLPRGATATRIDPYLVLVSEAMLQQTQVITVIPYFQGFITEFPTVVALANADEQRVLRLWQGLGYYSRARNLHAAAKRIVAEFAGEVPTNLADLLTLPGVGQYTAGAVASIAHNVRAPILDGNVARVLCRIYRIESDPREKKTRELLWRLAEEILPRESVSTKRKNVFADFNSALMELGATVCTPRNPQCLICPVRTHCQAYAAGLQDRIPLPRKAKPTPLVRRWAFCIRRKDRGDRWLIEQRPATGRWAGMWQFITVEATGKEPTPTEVKRATNLVPISLQHTGTIAHTLTHRRYTFEVYICESPKGRLINALRPRAWVSLDDMKRYPFSVPHLKMIELLKGKSPEPKRPI